MVGQVCFVKLAGLWPSQRSAGIGRGVLDFELWQSTEERRSKIKSYVDFRICPDSPDCCGEILISVRRHGLPTIISDVVVEVLYPCVASQKRRF